jgi:hypothetical protein
MEGVSVIFSYNCGMVQDRRLPKAGEFSRASSREVPVCITEMDSCIDTNLRLALAQGHLQSKQATVFAIRDVHKGLCFVCVCGIYSCMSQRDRKKNVQPATLLQTDLGETANEEILLTSLCFSDKAKLQLNGLVKRRNSKIWGGESHCKNHCISKRQMCEFVTWDDE